MIGALSASSSGTVTSDSTSAVERSVWVRARAPSDGTPPTLGVAPPTTGLGPATGQLHSRRLDAATLEGGDLRR